jgi:hypothetical protein
VLASRRRLLYLLLVLALGSGALAVTKMAAWWVVVPPTIMLLGYASMLREAARADAERRELARTRATATAAVAAAKRAAPPVPAAPVPGPDAEVIDISASLSVAGHKFYDQYADAKQRAVGDLAPAAGPTGSGVPVRQNALDPGFIAFRSARWPWTLAGSAVDAFADPD